MNRKVVLNNCQLVNEEKWTEGPVAWVDQQKNRKTTEKESEETTKEEKGRWDYYFWGLWIKY